MAVPGRRNGVVDEDDYEEDNALFEENGVIEFDSDTPPHLRALATAAQLGDVNGLRTAIDNLTMGSINDAVEDGDTVLHLTCLYGHLPCVQLLVERGANLEVQDEDGAIPLHDACAGGYVEIVQFLINSANGTDGVKRMLESVDAEGDTPLHHAARGEHAAVVRLLLASGASPTKENTYGKAPTELADPGTEARTILEAASAHMAMGCE
ncbi:tankyrase-2 [Cucurbita maxima]|uniref:Tankyrase-2 n=1 Tax=Cucurbita maxima TaxID=3661 RepID=A0A6J1J6D4_CUCMA|nr:tankyrase-2 [Cucurbita maxima]